MAQIMVASTGLILAAGRFGLAPSANRLANAGLKLSEKNQGQLSGDPAGFTASDVLYGGSVGHSASLLQRQAHDAACPPRCVRLTPERLAQSSARASSWACAASARCKRGAVQAVTREKPCNATTQRRDSPAAVSPSPITQTT